MSSSLFTPVSFVVLGLIARDGPSTPYDLKVAVSRGVARFWSFPHSQLYSEPERLAGAGLLQETREATGRRRRVYDITDAGRSTLDQWLREPADELLQIRSLAILKLFFANLAAGDAVAQLAKEQAQLIESRLQHYEVADERLAAQPERFYQLAVLRMGSDMERAMLGHWEAIAASPGPKPSARTRAVKGAAT